MIEEFLALVDRSIHGRSGSVMYSGRGAFRSPSDLYLLGINPGGNPDKRSTDTVGRHIEQTLSVTPEAWSSYVDESWEGKPPGTHGMQPRVQHLLRCLKLDPRTVPASNVVFVRSRNEEHLQAEISALAALCWKVHEAVIERLSVKVVVCFGGTAGKWVCGKVGADRLIDVYVEDNDRRWTSETHVNGTGLQILTLSHPSRAAWTAPSSDPTGLAVRALERLRVSA